MSVMVEESKKAEATKWTLSEFIKEFGGILTERVKEEFKPLYTPLPAKEAMNRFSHLFRKPFLAQAHTALGVYEALKKQNSVYLIGEMGTGKTFTSLAVVSLFEKPQRVLVLCPPHLVRKWKREVEETIPGARAEIISSISQLEQLRERKGEKAEVHEFYIVSREKAKLHYGWRHGLLKKGGSYVCPSCFSSRTLIEEELGYDPFRRKAQCPFCGEQLWQADSSRIRRYSLGMFIKKYLRSFFDIFIADEVHEYKSGSSIQGQVFGMLASAIKKKILLTGTLMGGYAHNLFHLLWRTHTKEMKELGFTYRSEQEFQKRYGFVEKVFKVKNDEDYDYGVRKKRRQVRMKALPGISPGLFPELLLSNAVFVRLSDVAEALPPYREEVHLIEMNEEQRKVYLDVESSIRREVVAYQKGFMKNLSTLLTALLLLPDAVYRENYWELENGDITNEVVEGLMPKEEKLLELCLEAKRQGRKTLVYVTFTGTRDISPRIQEILEGAGLKTAVLYSTVPAVSREEWVEERLNEGIDVLITNPKLVETGLDLIAFPEVVFYQTGYSIYTLRQASRRSWRIGQKQKVKVHFLAYKDTLQEKALGLIASKMDTSLMVEGELSDKGLAELSQAEGSMMKELAKALVGEIEVESPLEKWKSFKQVETISEAEAWIQKFSFKKEKDGFSFGWNNKGYGLAMNIETKEVYGLVIVKKKPFMFRVEGASPKELILYAKKIVLNRTAIWRISKVIDSVCRDLDRTTELAKQFLNLESGRR